MSNIDTKYKNTYETLRAVGFQSFVEFYYDFKNPVLSRRELSEKIARESPRSFSAKQGFRIPRARHIFEKGQQIEALEIIICSNRMPEEIKNRAKEILEKEKLEQQNTEEYGEEHSFIGHLNQEIIYSDNHKYDYDNTPKPTKKTVSHTGTVYPRSRIVAQNALFKAKCLCEVDPSHKVFKRKNSDLNYTEPHHLIPLYAHKDFPEIDIDREQNVVSLCSHCHNLLHYGADIDAVLEKLYNKRKDVLKQIGIDISYSQLKKYYE